MQEIARGALSKMAVRLEAPVQYGLRLGEQEIPLNPLLGQRIRLDYLGAIHCCHCGKRTKKSYSQGYCYPCMTKLAQCDQCIVSPEKCHYAAGTCREPAWGEQFCMTGHLVYLANSSGIKVGITRASQVPTRWIDQGAVQALPILRTATRQQAGFAEDLLRQQVADRTNWRAMLKGDVELLDLPAIRDRLLANAADGIAALQQRFGLQAIQLAADAQVTSIEYPVLQHPQKVASFDLDKTPQVEGTLLGIKGQYLILDGGVINLRKYSSYLVAVSAG